jgi:hypothetical protein
LAQLQPSQAHGLVPALEHQPGGNSGTRRYGLRALAALQCLEFLFKESLQEVFVRDVLPGSDNHESSALS